MKLGDRVEPVSKYKKHNSRAYSMTSYSIFKAYTVNPTQLTTLQATLQNLYHFNILIKSDKE